MADLIKFYEGGISVSEYHALGSGELMALVEYRDAYVAAQKKAAKGGK